MSASQTDQNAASEVLGAQANLPANLQDHLFLIGPNNSGSTFVARALETCRDVWRLPREGQHMLGYRGPDLAVDQKELVWAASKAYLEGLQDPARYDWERTKQAWYFQAKAHHMDAASFFTKAPPFLAVFDQLLEAFEGAKIIFLVRNPYAVVEAICRYNPTRLPVREEALKIAANHIMNCFAMMRRNIDDMTGPYAFFTYEELCADPAQAARKVIELMPRLGDLDFDQKLQVKGRYNERLRNMNPDQIARLSREDIATINRVFASHEQLLKRFGYEMLSE